jgi:hypothetical protein
MPATLFFFLFSAFLGFLRPPPCKVPEPRSPGKNRDSQYQEENRVCGKPYRTRPGLHLPFWAGDECVGYRDLDTDRFRCGLVLCRYCTVHQVDAAQVEIGSCCDWPAIVSHGDCGDDPRNNMSRGCQQCKNNESIFSSSRTLHFLFLSWEHAGQGVCGRKSGFAFSCCCMRLELLSPCTICCGATTRYSQARSAPEPRQADR